MLNPQSTAGQEFAQLPNMLVTKLDVCNLEDIRASFNVANARFKRVDVVVNNAGYGQYGVIEVLSREQIRAQYAVNVFGVIDIIKAFLPHFRANEPINGRRGAITNMGSGSGLFCLPALAMYSSSKSALAGLTEAISYELSSQLIATKLVVPYSGVTHTSFHESSADPFAKAPSLEPYNSFITMIVERYQAMPSDLTFTSEDVAQSVYEAATDKEDKLRFYIGHDATGMLQKKLEWPEEQCTQFMQAALMS